MALLKSSATSSAAICCALLAAEMRDLSRLFQPKSIAVFGGWWAENVVTQCQKNGFEGDIWPVHPTRDDINGIACYRDVADLPAGPDAAFLGINRHAAVEITAALAARGCGGAVCFASGFAETGDDALQAALIAAAGDMPLLGPNCYGVLNYLDGAMLWPDQHGGRLVDSGVALISQSSNIVINMSMQARGLPIAYIACVGNQAQTSLTEMARTLLADDRVTAAGTVYRGHCQHAGFRHHGRGNAQRRQTSGGNQIWQDGGVAGHGKLAHSGTCRRRRRLLGLSGAMRRNRGRHTRRNAGNAETAASVWAAGWQAGQRHVLFRWRDRHDG
jgi:hypothetical protein